MKVVIARPITTEDVDYVIAHPSEQTRVDLEPVADPVSAALRLARIGKSECLHAFGVPVVVCGIYKDGEVWRTWFLMTDDFYRCALSITRITRRHLRAWMREVKARRIECLTRAGVEHEHWFCFLGFAEAGRQGAFIRYLLEA